MAGFYWYERNPQLFNDEKQAMNLYFPNFVLDRLADGRICWVVISIQEVQMVEHGL